jgi:hypothetical protein
MRRSTTKYLLSAGLLALGSLTLLSGCVNNDSSLFVLGVIDTNQSTCVAKPDTTSAMLAAGVMDTEFTQSYTAALLVGNQLTEQGSTDQVRTETSRISLRGAEVTLTSLNGQTTYGKYSTVGTGFVDPSSGDTPSYAAMFVNIIPAGIPGLSQTVVLAKIRVFGNTLGGKSITSSELDFPITVCQGCLVDYPSSADNPTAGSTAYMCTDSASTSTTATTAVAPCITGQDEHFSCTLCSSSHPLCADPSLNPSYSAAATP